MVAAFIILLSVLAIISLMVGLHLFLPIIGGAIVFTTGIWFLILVAIVFFITAIILLITLVKVSITLLTLPFVLLTLIGLIVFPSLFPILVPLLLIFIAIAILRNANRKQLPNDQSNHSE